TAEARGAYLTQRLRESGLPRSLQSDIHRRLAEFYRERRQDEQAGAQIEKALRLMPMNLSARTLAYEMFGETEPLLQRVEMALQLIRMNPSQVNVLWELGELLDSYGMQGEAIVWYQRALDIHRRATGEPPSPDRVMAVAIALADVGKYEESLSTLDPLLAAPASARATTVAERVAGASARLLRAYVAERAAAALPVAQPPPSGNTTEGRRATRMELSALATSDIAA